MQKNLFIIVLFLFAAVTVSAQGLYLDAGGGLGMASTEYWAEISSSYSDDGTRTSMWPLFVKTGFGYDVGGKIGYGPFPRMPLYIVGDISWTIGSSSKQGLEDTANNYYRKTYSEQSVNHLFFGPGFVFYPIENFQFSASIGLVNAYLEIKDTDVFSYTLSSESHSYTTKESGIGFGFNLSAAIDLGGKSGLLLGGKWSYIESDIDFEYKDHDFYSDQKVKFDFSTFYFGLFVKYRFRG